MTRTTIAAVAFALVAAATLHAVGSDKAQYIGGTITTVQEKAEAKLNLTSETEFVFDAGKKGAVSIPYAGITEIEYGQKAGRRVGAAILVSPLALFSKARKHFFTITFTDAAGKNQVAVFEFGKDIFRQTIKIVEVRSGKELILQDNEACKQYKNAKECEGGK